MPVCPYFLDCEFYLNKYVCNQMPYKDKWKECGFYALWSYEDLKKYDP